jgi:small conductance mechanosensitive channel
MDYLKSNQASLDKLATMALSYAPKLLLALLTLIIGFWISKRVASGLLGLLNLNKVDPSLGKWLTSFLSITLKILVIISVASMIGVETTSFVALLGAAGLAVGLALQGSLSNFAGGLLILFFKPFTINDFISAQGEEGYVEAIDIFCTYIRTFDNKMIILPNGALAGDKIINMTKLNTRRINLEVGISYNNDYKIAAEALINMALKESRILRDPAPFVGVKDYGDSSINLVFRAWCNTPDYWELFYILNNNIKNTLDEAKISIPYPQRDVHIYN